MLYVPEDLRKGNEEVIANLHKHTEIVTDDLHKHNGGEFNTFPSPPASPAHVAPEKNGVFELKIQDLKEEAMEHHDNGVKIDT